MRRVILALLLLVLSATTSHANPAIDCVDHGNPQSRVKACTELLKIPRDDRGVLAQIEKKPSPSEIQQIVSDGYFCNASFLEGLTARETVETCTRYIQSAHLVSSGSSKKNLSLAYISRAESYLSLRQRQKAISDYKKALQLNPKDKAAAKALQRLGVAHEASTEVPVSNPTPAPAPNPSNPNPGPLNADLKKCALWVGDFNEKIEACTKYINSGAGSGKMLAGAYTARGLSYQVLKQRDNAVADFKKALELDPTDRSAKGALADLGIKTPKPAAAPEQELSVETAAAISFCSGTFGDGRTAIAACTKIIDSGMTDHDWHIKAYRNRAKYYRELGEFGKASADEQKLKELTSKSKRTAPAPSTVAQTKPPEPPNTFAPRLPGISLEGAAPTLVTQLIGWAILGLILILPLWKIHARAGLKPALSLLIFVPYLGLLIVIGLLAFRPWPAAATGQPRAGP